MSYLPENRSERMDFKATTLSLKTRISAKARLSWRMIGPTGGKVARKDEERENQQ